MSKLFFNIKVVWMIVLLTSGTISLIAQNDDSFETVKIGEQLWMTENLNVVKFRNGDSILHAETNEDWLQAAKEGIPAWSYYDNNPENGDSYGKLYNWFAVNDPRGLAPEGWELPTYDDLTILIDFVDKNLAGFFDDNATGRILKSTSGWKDNGSGTNESKFSALPGGWRYFEGPFYKFGETGYWWTSTSINRAEAWALRIVYDGDYVIRMGSFKANGYAVRCLKQD